MQNLLRKSGHFILKLRFFILQSRNFTVNKGNTFYANNIGDYIHAIFQTYADVGFLPSSTEDRSSMFSNFLQSLSLGAYIDLVP